MTVLVGWFLTVVILTAYWRSTKTGRMRTFDVANAVTFAPLAVVNVLLGSWFGALMNVVFGVVAIRSLRRRRHGR